MDDEKKQAATSSEGAVQEMVKPHIYFIMDTTGSMGSYITSLGQVLDQIFRIVRILFSGNVHLHIISYKDYCDKEVIAECHDNAKMQEWVKEHLKPSGGGDSPEAIKTALNILYKQVASDPTNTIVFNYTDAPPHHSKTGSSNIAKEKAAIKKEHPAPAPGFDWTDICAAFSKLAIPFYTFVATSMDAKTRSFYKMLGDVILMPNVNADTITKATIGVMNQLMACEDPFKFADAFKLIQYADQLQVDYNYLSALKNEDDCNGLLPSNKAMVKFDEISFETVRPLDFLSNVLKTLPKKLLYDEKYRDLVFAEFKHIFTEENILCISYNSVFGSIWRHLCRFREDERLNVLKNTFSVIISNLDESKKKEMQEWLDESYDDTQEINDIIKKHIDAKQNESIRYMTMDAVDMEQLPTKKELLTVAHSLYGDIIYKLQAVMTHLIVVQREKGEPAPFDEKVNNTYIGIPCSLNNKRFFSLLSHLIVNGTMFTLRPTLIIAMIAYLSGNVLLKERSKQILMENKGKWILLEKLEEFPEFISVPFTKLVIRCNKAMGNQLLTNDEEVFYSKLYKVYRVRLTKPKLFDIRVGFEPKKKEIYSDFKRKCKKCNEMRSFSLMLPKDECAICKQQTLVEDYKGCPENEALEDKAKKSYSVSCKSCQGIYAVVEIDALNVQPKCFYCRQNTEYDQIPVINCSVCLNRFILPNPDYFGSNSAAQNKWVCACCTEDKSKAVETSNASFEELVGLFPMLLSNIFNINTKPAVVKDLFSSMSLYKLYMKYKDDLYVTGGGAEEKKSNEDQGEGNVETVIDILNKEQAKYKGRIMHNVAELIGAIFEAVSYGKLGDFCCYALSRSS